MVLPRYGLMARGTQIRAPHIARLLGAYPA